MSVRSLSPRVPRALRALAAAALLGCLAPSSGCALHSIVGEGPGFVTRLAWRGWQPAQAEEVRPLAVGAVIAAEVARPGSPEEVLRLRVRFSDGTIRDIAGRSSGPRRVPLAGEWTPLLAETVEIRTAGGEIVADWRDPLTGASRSTLFGSVFVARRNTGGTVVRCLLTPLALVADAALIAIDGPLTVAMCVVLTPFFLVVGVPVFPTT